MSKVLIIPKKTLEKFYNRTVEKLGRRYHNLPSMIKRGKISLDNRFSTIVESGKTGEKNKVH